MMRNNGEEGTMRDPKGDEEAVLGGISRLLRVRILMTE